MNKYLLISAMLLAGACGDGESTDTDNNDDTGEVSKDVGPVALASCVYVNAFSQAAECKEYLGANWTLDGAADDCAAPGPGADPGELTEGASCDRTSYLAECVVDEDGPDAYTLVFPGEEGDSCDNLSLGCTFAGGDYRPSELCDSADDGQPGGGGAVTPFVPFEKICVDPIEGEPEGESADGKVCTWEAISGSTEEGRRFVDYASCEAVVTQRPYWAASVENNTASDDPRLSDPDWVEEYEWVTSQVESSSCVCCHSEIHAPDGPSGWYLEADPIWTDTLDDDGMAMMAGWVDSTVFGSFDPEDNNGFDRSVAGIGTTDSDRMIAFWAGELARKGLYEEDFTDNEPFGGVLYDQLLYVPEACSGGVGIDAEGTITWTGGAARYIYVMEEGSDNPGVPPNLDKPVGTVWRFDMDHTKDGVQSGDVVFGQVPTNGTQIIPDTGMAPSLEAGETYYLYVLRDIYQPLSRCTFTAQ